MYELFIWLVVALIGLGIISSLVGAALAYYDHIKVKKAQTHPCLLYTSPSPRD